MTEIRGEIATSAVINTDSKLYKSYYCETCLNRTIFGSTFVFGIDRHSVYTG